MQLVDGLVEVQQMLKVSLMRFNFLIYALFEEFLNATELMWKQSVHSSVISARIAAEFLKKYEYYTVLCVH